MVRTNPDQIVECLFRQAPHPWRFVSDPVLAQTVDCVVAFLDGHMKGVTAR